MNNPQRTSTGHSQENCQSHPVHQTQPGTNALLYCYQGPVFYNYFEVKLAKFCTCLNVNTEFHGTAFFFHCIYTERYEQYFNYLGALRRYDLINSLWAKS